MEQCPLGSTSLSVSRIGLGLAALGRPGYITLGHSDDLDHDYDVEAMRGHAWRVLDLARTLGVRYVDAARSYGRAEEFLSGWLASRAIAPGEIVVGSKWGYTYTAAWSVEADAHELKDHSIATLQRQQQESLDLLGPWLRLYQIHSATTSSGVLDRPDVLNQLASLRDQHGLTIGLTLSGPDSAATLERAMAIRIEGQRLFDAVQATWNILEPSLGQLLATARSDGMGVIVKEVLANGRLTTRNSDPAFADTRSVLMSHAERLGCSIEQLAIAAALDRSWADCVLSGAATEEQLRSSVTALTVSLDDNARDALSELAESSQQYWETRSALRWN